MKVTYDPRYNIAYIRLREKSVGVESLRVSDEMNIDLAPDGTVYGIELLNAIEQIPLFDNGKLLVVNEATGKTMEMEF